MEIKYIFRSSGQVGTIRLQVPCFTQTCAHSDIIMQLSLHFKWRKKFCIRRKVEHGGRFKPLQQEKHEKKKPPLLTPSCRRVHRKFLTVPEPVNGANREPGMMLPHCTKTLRWLVIFLKPHPLIMCLKKRYGFSELWVQSLRSMGSECQWAKQRVAKMGFGGFETQAPGPLWSKLSRGYRETE